MLSLRFALLMLAGLVAFALGVPASALADNSHKQPPICVVLYLESQGPAGEPSASLLDLRDRLRSNDRLEVLVFEPDSPTFVLAARSVNPPISLDSVNNAATRLALAQAAGAQFAVMAAPTDIGSDDADLKVFEISPASRNWIFENKSPKDGAKAVANQIITAAAEPPPASPPAAVGPSPASPAQQVAVPTPQTNSAAGLSAGSAAQPAPGAAAAATPSIEPPASALPEQSQAAPALPAPTESLPAVPSRRSRRKAATPAKAPAEEPLITQSPLAAPSDAPSLDAVSQSMIAKGDIAMEQSDLYGAIEFYEEAVNAAPREAGPRMKLIDAYLQAGLKDQALDEERRALMIDPGNTQILDMLKQQTADGTLPEADLAIQEAAVERDPTDEPSWIALGDAYWNSSEPDKALQAYQKAAKLAPQDVSAQAHLARLYAATSQYDKSLDALTKAGPAGYPYALRIIAARTDNLVADLDLAYDTFSKGNSTREEFYDSVEKSDSQAQELSQFVAKITPPSAYEVSYLHRRLATNLLAQATTAWISFIETNDSQFRQQATLFQSEATSEMKTASIAERLQSSLSASSH